MNERIFFQENFIEEREIRIDEIKSRNLNESKIKCAFENSFSSNKHSDSSFSSDVSNKV
jgi:hypothetical protein